MSQHIFKATTAQSQQLTITMGYDRPLKYVFCTVMTEDDDVVYSNLDDEGAGIHQQQINYYRPVLLGLGLIVPESMFREVEADQLAQVGNRVVIHHAAP